MTVMFHYKHQDAGISFIGYNEEEGVYSLDYYANNGIVSAPSKHTSYKEVKRLRKMCEERGYKRVNYLPK